MKIEIKNRWTGNVFFGFETEGNTISKTVKAAIEARANLIGADLIVIKNDLWRVLIENKNEVEGLLKSLEDGKINGSQYSGECSCLKGTLAKCKGFATPKAAGLVENIKEPAEKWFLQIHEGHTPETPLQQKSLRNR